MSDAKFDEALEAVFEDRSSSFSSHLREMLEQLWLEGVKEGRAQGRLESANLERHLEATLHDSIISSSKPKDLELTLDAILEVANELEKRHGLVPRVHDELALALPPPGVSQQEILGEWVAELTSWNSRMKTSPSSPPSSILEHSRRFVTALTSRDESDKS